MGILDKLREKLAGVPASAQAGPAITGPVQPSAGAMDELAKRLESREAIKFFQENASAMGSPIKMPERDAQGNPALPTGGDRFRETFVDPRFAPEALAKKREDAARAQAALAIAAGQPSIGPATEAEMNAPRIVPTEAQLAAKYDVESESYDAGKLRALAQFLDRIHGKVQAGSGETWKMLAKAGDTLQRLTGIPKGGLFERLAADADYWRDYFYTKAAPAKPLRKEKPTTVGDYVGLGIDQLTGIGSGNMPKTGEIAADTVGQLLWDLPQILALGPYGLAIHGGIYGLHRGGPRGMMEGAVAGGLTHGIFKGISELPTLWQMPVAAGTGAFMTAMETDDPQQILANSVSWSILQHQKGAPYRTAKEVAAGLPWAQDIAKAAKIMKGEEAVRLLKERGISREEFILRFPEMRAHMNDDLAEHVILSLGLGSKSDLPAIRDAGGGMKLLEFTLNPMQHQFRLAIDMVRARIGLPSAKVADALQYVAQKLGDESLIRSHLEAKMAINEGAPAMMYWRESILRGEIEARGLRPLTSGAEYVNQRYGPQGWDLVTGKTAVERQAEANIIEMLNKRGILVGRAAAEAEGDNEPVRGPINPAILKNAYESEVGRLLGLNPMRTAPQWLDFFQGRGVKKGAWFGEPAKPGTDTANLLQFYLGRGGSRGFTTMAGYYMVPAPPNHPGANSRGLIGWHRLVLETKIGRLLEDGEVAHHINHKPEDNRPENLMLMNRDEHIRHHMSAEGRNIDQAILDEAMKRGPEKHYRLENLDTMELRPVGAEVEPGPREVKFSVQRTRGGKPDTNVELWGKDVEEWEVRQASRGKIQFGPEGEPPEGSMLPSGEKFMGLERFRVERNGDVTMIAHVKDADGQLYTRELTRLTPEEIVRYRSGKNWGGLIDDIVERVSTNRPAGGVQAKRLKPGEKAAKEIGKDIMIERIVPPYEMHYAESIDEEPGRDEIMTRGDEILKRGPGVTQRKLDETRWPKPEEPPRGTEPYPEGLLLHDDFKAREQPTVRDVFEGHKENGASTINLYEGDMAGSDMWAVSLYPERTYKKEGKDLSKKEIYNFIRKNADLLSSDPRLNVGTWYNAKDGHTYVDVTLLLPRDQGPLAEELGRKYNQISVTLLDKEYTFPSVETGGTGKPLPDAGWAPESERLNELFETGEKKTIYHFGNAPDVTPHAMGRGEMGEEGRQFYKGYRGTQMLRRGYYLKSNFYTPETANIEAHRWGGKGVGKGEIDMGQLFNAGKDFDPESDLTLDQQAVRAGKRGWYDPETEQVRLFNPTQIKGLGMFQGLRWRDVRGSEIEKFVLKDNESLTSGPEDPPERYGNSVLFGDKYYDSRLEGTQAVDPYDGMPVLVHHGTPFKDKIKREGWNPESTIAPGAIYFSSSKSFAKDYASGERGKAGIFSGYLSIKNPMTVDIDELMGYPIASQRADIAKAKKLGHDGIIANYAMRNRGYDRTDYIIFDPKQFVSVEKAPSGGHKFGIVAPGTNETADVINRLRFLIFDKFHPIHQLTKLLEASGIDVPAMKNPSMMVKLLGGVTGKGDARVFYKRYSIDPDGKITFAGKSLKDIYAPHKGDMAGFDDWLWARAEREEHRLNRSRTPDEQVQLELTKQEAEQIYQAGVKKYGQAGREFTEYFHSMLDELADSGLMTTQAVAELKAKRPDYAPLRKDLDELAAKLDAASGTNSARQTLDRVKSPIKTRRGTEKAFTRIPPTQAAVLMTYEITSAAERNRAARAIVDLRDLSPEMARLIRPTRPKITYVRDISTGKDVPTIGRQESDTIAVSIDGKRHFFKVPEDVAQSMKLIYETGLGRWTKLAAIPARTLRTGATAAPEFAFRNPLRDWLTAYMNAKKGFNPITDFPRGLFHLIFQGKGPQGIYKAMKTDPEAYWKWKAAGGEWSMLVSLDKALGEQAVKQMHRETDTGLRALRKYIKSPLGYLEAVSEAGEKPTRIGVFEKARRKGMSDVEAAVESREASTDFAVRGAETKAFSALYTFLNARAQTTMKLGKTAIENPGRFAIKGLAAAGIPSLVLYAINRNDPDYWKRDQMERDLYWFLPIDVGGRQVKIPKGEIGLIFGTAVEKVLTWLDHEGALPEGKGGRPPLNPKVTEFLEEVFQNVSPVGNWGETLPTFARPIAEWVNNKSYYYGTPLESEADRGVAPYLRYKPGTSEVMKELGKAMGVLNKGEGVSPIMLENTLRGYTGGVGRHALKGIDIAADVTGITDKGARPSDPMNIPGAAGFVSRRASGFESEPSKAFYDMANKIDMTKRTLDELVADKTRSKEVLTWIKQHPQEMALLKVTRTKDPETGQVKDLFNDAKRKLADLRKQANLIAEDKSLSAKQKRQAMDFLDKKISEIVDPMWNLINAASQIPSKK